MIPILPLIMIGRRASGKTTALALLLGQCGFHSSASGLDYSINTNDPETREYLFGIYKRIKSGENPTPSEIHNLEKLQLYADVNGERVPFEIPDVAGEHFEGGETKDQIIEKTRSELMGLIANAGVLVIILDYDILQETGAIDYTNQVGVVLSELKKERYQGQGFLPPVVVAVSKFDKHPLYTRDFVAQQKLLEEDLEKSEYLKQIKAIVTGAAGAGNCCFVPISAYGGFKVVEENGQKTFFPPEEIAPSGLVELLEISMKKLMHQSFLLLTRKPDTTLPQIAEKILKLQALMDFAPYPEIDAEIEEELKKLKPLKENLRQARKIKILTGSIALIAIVFLVLVFSLLVKPLHERTRLLSTGKAFIENRQDLKNIADIQAWINTAEKFVESNSQLDSKELVEKLALVKKEYATTLVDAEKKRCEAAINAEFTHVKKIAVIDSLLQAAKEDYQKSFLLERRKEFYELESQNNLKIFLANLGNLPVSQQINELTQQIENARANKDDSALAEFQKRLSRCDQKYYQETVENLAVKIKTAFEKNEILTFDELQKLSALCTTYRQVLPSGKMVDKCAKFGEFYEKFHNKGINCDLEFTFPATDDDYEFVDASIKLGKNQKSEKDKIEDPATNKTGKLKIEKFPYKLQDDFIATITFIDHDYVNDDNLVFGTEIRGKIIPFTQTEITLLSKDPNNFKKAVLTLTCLEHIDIIAFPGKYE